MSSYRKSKPYSYNNKKAVSKYPQEREREDTNTNNIEPPLPLLPSVRSRHSSSSQNSSSSAHERRVVVESDDKMLSSNNICNWIQSSTQKYDALKADYDELKSRHDQLLADFHHENLEKTRLSFHVDELREENAGFRRQIDELQKRARDQAARSAPLRNNLKATQAKLREKADELLKRRDEKKKLLEEIRKLNSRKTDLSSINQNYEARERKMKIDLEKLSGELKKEKTEKEQLKAQLGLKNEEITRLQESSDKLDKTVHRVVQFVNDDIVKENDKMLRMLIATQEGTVSTMNEFLDKYNKERGIGKVTAEGWGKLKVSHSKLFEESVAKAIMPQQENNEAIHSTSCDDGATAKRGADDDGHCNQGADDNTPFKRSRMSVFTQNDDTDVKRMGRGKEQQQTGTTADQQFELPPGASISVEDEDTGNGFHEYISSPSDSDFAIASATSSSSSEDYTTRFVRSIKQEPADVPEESNVSSATNSISNSYISSGLRSWSD